MTITWNLVAKNIRPDSALEQELRKKIGRLEARLEGLLPPAPHLQIFLEKHPRKESYTTVLRLRTRVEIFESNRAAPASFASFDAALEALEREMERVEPKPHPERKALPRKGAPPGGRKPREGRLEFAAEPLRKGRPPESAEDMVRDFFRQHYDQLLHHARGHIRDFELTEEIPSGALDARDLVDEAARQAEVKAREKPETMSWLVWIYHLLHQELRRQRDALRQEAIQDVSVEERVTLPELRPQALLPLEKIIQKDMEPEVIKIEDVMADPEAAPPDQLEAAKDLLEYLQRSIQARPRVERDVFEFYVVQGFEPAEVARKTGQSLKKVKDIVTAIQRRLLEELRTEEAA